MLLNSDVKASRCPIVLLCNKQDEELARGTAPIQAAVEREVQGGVEEGDVVRGEGLSRRSEGLEGSL